MDHRTWGWTTLIPTAGMVAAGTGTAAEGLPELFARYNPRVWPGHALANVLGLVAIAWS